MAHDISIYEFELPDLDDWFAGDSHQIDFAVVEDGTAVDITNSTLEWRLFERAYETGDAAAVLTDSDSDVTIIDTAPLADPENGEWSVRLDGTATEDLYGDYYMRPVVDPQGFSRASWRGEVTVTA